MKKEEKTKSASSARGPADVERPRRRLSLCFYLYFYTANFRLLHTRLFIVLYLFVFLQNLAIDCFVEDWAAGASNDCFKPASRLFACVISMLLRAGNFLVTMTS